MLRPLRRKSLRAATNVVRTAPEKWDAAPFRSPCARKLTAFRRKRHSLSRALPPFLHEVCRSCEVRSLLPPLFRGAIMPLMQTVLIRDMFYLGVPVAEKMLRPVIVYVFLIVGLR